MNVSVLFQYTFIQWHILSSITMLRECARVWDSFRYETVDYCNILLTDLFLLYLCCDMFQLFSNTEENRKMLKSFFIVFLINNCVLNISIICSIQIMLLLLKAKTGYDCEWEQICSPKNLHCPKITIINHICTWTCS